MVGVPRSTGCRLCVKRRVKCDEGQPGCGNCTKYGATCPGYDRSFKFVQGKHQVRSRQRRQDPPAGPRASPFAHSQPLAGWDSSETDQHSFGDAAGSPSSVSDSTSSASGPNANFAVAFRHRFGRPATREQRGSQPTTSTLISQKDVDRPFVLWAQPRDSRAFVICSMIQSFRDAESRQESMYFSPWFASVSQHLGNKMTLDSAVTTITLHLLGKARGDQAAVGESRALYGKSLTALQKALSHPTEWREPETLCATMMLCLFELFAGTAMPNSWMQHAKGVALLVQQRGSAAHRSAWESTMLMSFRGLLIMNSLFSGQDCFLAKRQWQKLMLRLAEQHPVDDPVERDRRTIMDEYFAHLARVPSILRHGLALREASRHGMPIDAETVVMLVQHAEKLRADFLAWYDKFQRFAAAPKEVPSNDPVSIYDSVLQYDNPWIGSIYLGYSATMVILQECLNQCKYPVDFTESNCALVRFIFRSIEHVGSGLMGPFRVGYAIRIAFEFGDLRTQTWVRSKLAVFERTYAATSPEDYPKPTQNEYNFL